MNDARGKAITIGSHVRTEHMNVHGEPYFETHLVHGFDEEQGLVILGHTEGFIYRATTAGKRRGTYGSLRKTQLEAYRYTLPADEVFTF